jgi:hypothetical protein
MANARFVDVWRGFGEVFRFKLYEALFTALAAFVAVNLAGFLFLGACGGKSTGPRTPEGLERSRRANWKHGHFSREAKAERSRLRAAIRAIRYVRDSI